MRKARRFARRSGRWDTRRTAVTCRSRAEATRSGIFGGDALEAVKGGEIVTMDGQRHDICKWGLLIAHPPCTYLTSCSAVWLFNADHTVKDLARERKGWEAKEFFLALLRCGVERIAVENPTPLRYFGLPRYDQIIEPYMFGDPWRKRTCLWLRGLPPLRPTNTVEPKGLWVGARKVSSKYTLTSNRNSKIRAKTFHGIAAAMAAQWGGDIR